MRRRARASGGKKITGGLWSLIRRMFGAPKGRHVASASSATSPAPAASPAPEALPEAEPLIPVVPVVPVVPEMAVSAVQAAQPGVPTTTGLASIRLIFTDGSVVALLEGSVEGRQAQYLARRVLEAGRRP